MSDHDRHHENDEGVCLDYLDAERPCSGCGRASIWMSLIVTERNRMALCSACFESLKAQINGQGVA